MKLRAWRQYRKFAAALALLGALFYAALLPGHLTSQFAAVLFRADLSQFAGAICHGGGDGKPGSSAPAESCPICKSLSALAFGMLPTPQVEIPAFEGGSVLGAPVRRAVVEATPLIPRSRGPPHSS